MKNLNEILVEADILISTLEKQINRIACSGRYPSDCSYVEDYNAAKNELFEARRSRKKLLQQVS